MTGKKSCLKKMPKPFPYISAEIIYMVAVMTNPVELACPSFASSLLPLFHLKPLLGKTVDIEKNRIEE